MHANGKKLQVCVASWSLVWNFTLLGNTTVDRGTADCAPSVRRAVR